jgi:phosphatidylinositol 3,5-bisphosphate 5-phosphatase
MDPIIGFDPLRNISIYESRSLIIIVGLCAQSQRYHLLEIKRSLGSSDASHEMVSHPESYTEQEMNSIIATAKCVSIISNAFCIFGFIQLVESCYIVVVTKAQAVANLHEHDLFTVTETNLLPITYKVRNTMDESRYKSILQNMNLANNDFYFSYDYDLTKSMQRQAISKENLQKGRFEIVESKFVWNYYALKRFTGYDTGERAESTTIEKFSSIPAARLERWMVPVIHGYLRQKTMRLETGDTVKYTLIARRSRLFAGTRYLRRGVDSDGFTANEVETEQIVTRKLDRDRKAYRSSSLCQIRGSIPLYWHHTNLFVPSPDIKVNELDYGYDAALLHFNMLKQSFGDRITVLNLVRTQNSAREVVVGQAFSDLITSLNEFYRRTEDPDSVSEITTTNELHTADDIKEQNNLALNTAGADSKVEYVAFDFHGTPHNTLFSQLDQLCEEIFPRSGFFLLAQRGQKEGEREGSSQYVPWCAYSAGNHDVGAKELAADTGRGTDRGTAIQDEKNTSRPLPYSIEEEMGDASNQISYDDLGGGMGSGFPVGVLQTGVLRTNCVDCLDRTNVAQFCYARHSLFHQLRALGDSVFFADVLFVVN